ncbi:hypothetical protein ACQP2T_53590 [Nonomuraea sp. CA-143628]|uniref:hypothetical protein n=1 Tax=Nonomuraea sp. CA-143628 TaxID=3239997 RepID=UPI003D8B2513
MDALMITDLFRRHALSFEGLRYRLINLPTLRMRARARSTASRARRSADIDEVSTAAPMRSA